MADVLTKEQRSKCMAAVKGKNTKPEIIVRKFLFSKGLRYRLHDKKLPGHPDIVLKKYKTVIFIDGCFWHGHEGCCLFKMPKSNQFYWENKIKHNKARDIANDYVLSTMGWKVIRIWECEIKNTSVRISFLENIYSRITSSYPSFNYSVPELPSHLAAEPSEDYN